MSAKVSAKKAKQPMCDGTLRHSMADYQHLDGVGDRAKISIDKDERLATAAWRTEFNVSRPNMDMGHYLAVALKANKTSWVLLNLAAMYWRAEGNATQSVECLRRALHHSPYEQRDIALVQLGIILTMANYTDDALIVIEAALDISDTLYATHYAYGNVLTALGSYVQAQEAYERAVELQPDLGAAYSMLASVSAVIKTTAVQSRRKYEINLRKVSMVLSDHLQWEDFEYEAVEDPCFDAVCQKHSTCSKIDGKCHCNEGYLADNQVCKVDKACAVDKCKGNSICRNGRCFCKIGYELEGGMCVKDKCAQVTCVDQAQCNPDDGRCYCAAPYVRRGAECVDPECASVSCQANSVCRLGQCYCLVGYIPKGDACVKDAACTRSSCPAHSTCSDKDGHCRCDADYTADVHRNVCLNADGSEAAEAEPVNLDKPVKLSQGAPDVGSKAGKSGRMLPQTESELVESLSVLPEMCEKMAAGLDELVYSISLYLPLNDSANNEVSAVAAKIMPRKKPSETKSRKLPTCSFSYKVASVHRMDDITDVAAATSSDPPNWAKKVWPDPQARTHLLDLLFRKTGLTPDGSTDTVYAEIGHRIAARLKKDPKNPFTLDLAVLWWRAKGNVVEALKCLQYFLHTASDKHRGSGYAQGANIMLLARRLHGAAIFSELSKSLLPKEPLCLFSHAIIEAASGKLEEAAQSMVELLGDHPKQEVVEDALNRIRCAQFREHQKALENKSTTTTGDFYGEAKDLNQRLKAMQKLLTGTALDDSAKGPELDKIWEQLAEDETRLRRLYEMQQLASKLKQDVADLGSIKDAGGVDVGDQDGRGAAAQKPGHRGRRKLSTREDTTADTGVKVVLHDKAGTATFAADGVDDSDSTDAAAKTKGGSPKVVVVEYPKAPSIPSLIAAVAEMFEKKKDGVSTGVDLPKRLAFEEEGWPSDKDCEAVAANHARFMSTWMSVAAKNVDIHKHIDIVSELETSSSKFQPPICNSPVTAKSVHTLEHLQGMAKRATITMLPEHALREVIRRVNEPRQTADKPPAELPAPLPIDEVGERTRLALKKNATSWVALNIAALYWRVEGNATEVRTLHAVDYDAALRDGVCYQPCCCVVYAFDSNHLGVFRFQPDCRPWNVCAVLSCTAVRRTKTLPW